LAEQFDPESRSNIAIFKEQRDALDHIMRGFGECFDKTKQPDEVYLRSQIEKARGHLFRAAYDALDGVGVSSKLRINDAMKGVSLDAIAAVYPEYYQHVKEIDEIDLKIAEHRRKKDVTEQTLGNLGAYCNDVERLSDLARGASHRRPAFQDWEKRNRHKTVRDLIGASLLLVVVGSVLNFAGDLYIKTHFPDSTANHSTASPSPPKVSGT
jgi:hypothetical protein